MADDYLTDIRLLKANVDIDSAHQCFEDTFAVIRDFIREVVLSTSELDRLSISSEARKQASYYLEKSVSFGSIPEVERKKISRQAWSDIRDFADLESKLISLTICCLWEKGDYLHDIDTCMQDNYITTVLISAYDFDPKLGRAFRVFLEQHPAMQKYRFTS